MLKTVQGKGQNWNLASGEELRVEIDEGQQCIVRLISGCVEVFGSSLGALTSFDGPCKFAVFTWGGATVCVNGVVDSAYVGNNPSMTEALSLHARLHSLRENAKGSLSTGPRVLICGRSDSGKSSLCKILLSYANRELEYRPLFVNLDVADASCCIPGTLSACQYSAEETKNFTDDNPVCPLVYWYGHENYKYDPEYFRLVLEQFAVRVNGRLQSTQNESKYSGAIINTGAWADNEGLDTIRRTVRIFKIDLIVVVEDDRLYSRIGQSIAPFDVGLVKLSRAPGVVEKDLDYRRQMRNANIRRYFYGPVSSMQLSPVLKTLPWDKIKIFRLKSSKVNTELLPVGQASVLASYIQEEVVITRDLIDCMLAVVQLQHEKKITECSCIGFCNIQEIDVEKKIIQLLMPAENDITQLTAFLGGNSIIWSE